MTAKRCGCRAALILWAIVGILTKECAAISSPAEAVESLERCLRNLQFKTCEAIFQQIREAIGQRNFPIDLFPMGLSRQSRAAEQASAVLSSRCYNMLHHWEEHKRKETFLEDLRKNRLMFAHHQVRELKDNLGIVLDQRTSMLAEHVKLREYIHGGYRPRGYSEIALEVHGLYLQIGVYGLSLLIPLVSLLPRRKKPSTCRVLTAGVLALGLLLAGHSFTAWIHANWGSPDSVIQVRRQLETVEPYVHEFESALADANHTVGYLSDYCEAMDLYNRTVLSGIIEFANNVSALASRESTDPEVALQLVVQTKERIKVQKHSLVKLSASRMRGSKNTDLDKLLEFLDYFEVFFSQVEINIFSNLKAGYDMNQFFMEHIDIISHHVSSGDLVSCVSILNELYRQQLAQLANLHKANRYVHDTNEAITQIRIESTRLQPELESEEMDFWIKKMASKGSMAALSLPMLAAFSVPVAAVAPIGIAGAAIALIGYNWKDAYEKAEKDTRAIIQDIIRLDDILRQTEEGLSNHERVLTMLMENVGDVLRAVNQTQSRFAHVQLGRSFSPREIDFLLTGASRTKDSVRTLNSRYENAMGVLFKRILTKAHPPPPPAPVKLELPDRRSGDPFSTDGVGAEERQEHDRYRTDDAIGDETREERETLEQDGPEGRWR
jgi:hypothetical protein